MCSYVQNINTFSSIYYTGLSYVRMNNENVATTVHYLLSGTDIRLIVNLFESKPLLSG